MLSGSRSLGRRVAIFRCGDQVIYPDCRYHDGGLVGCANHHTDNRPTLLHYKGGAFVLGKGHNQPMCFSEQNLKIVTAIDRLAKRNLTQRAIIGARVRIYYAKRACIG